MSGGMKISMTFTVLTI